METWSASLVLCEGNPWISDGFPSQKTVTQSFDVFFDLRLDKQLNKRLRSWWFETPSHPLWRHCNEVMICRLYGTYTWNIVSLLLIGELETHSSKICIKTQPYPYKSAFENIPCKTELILSRPQYDIWKMGLSVCIIDWHKPCPCGSIGKSSTTRYISLRQSWSGIS